MPNDRETANFFWHGDALSVYEWACVSSFCRAGFAVNLWSYGPLKLPDGALARDAALILPQSDLSRYTQGGVGASIAAFTDFFRYELLAGSGGWWIDTDVVCLRSAPEFGGFQQALVAGYEKGEKVNGAVLKINAPGLAARLKQEADGLAAARGNRFEWGAVGPHLLTDFARQPELKSQILPAAVFYPIHYSQADLVLDPTRRDEAQALCSSAHTYHVWNEIIRLWAVPKNVLPPAGSFLHQAFVAAAPELAQLPALPAPTLTALLGQAAARAEREDPGFVYHLRALGPSFAGAWRKRLGKFSAK